MGITLTGNLRDTHGTASPATAAGAGIIAAIGTAVLGAGQMVCRCRGDPAIRSGIAVGRSAASCSCGDSGSVQINIRTARTGSGPPAGAASVPTTGGSVSGGSGGIPACPADIDGQDITLFHGYRSLQVRALSAAGSAVTSAVSAIEIDRISPVKGCGIGLCFSGVIERCRICLQVLILGKLQLLPGAAVHRLVSLVVLPVVVACFIPLEERLIIVGVRLEFWNF